MGMFSSFFGKTLYFPGCPAKFLQKDVQDRHEALLRRFGIKYVTLPKKEVCCGKPALDFGFKDDFRALRKTNTDIFKDHKIRKIITTSPGCYYVFKKNYMDHDIDIVHMSQVILDNVDKIEKRYQGQQVTFFDPCNPHKLPELYDNPRKILEALGLKVANMPNCREKSLCCGKALEHISPKVGEHMAKEILSSVKTRTLVTTSTDCYRQLRSVKGFDVRIRELSEVLV